MKVFTIIHSCKTFNKKWDLDCNHSFSIDGAPYCHGVWTTRKQCLEHLKKFLNNRMNYNKNNNTLEEQTILDKNDIIIALIENNCLDQAEKALILFDRKVIITESDLNGHILS